jgi:hypothetical protein
MIVIVIVIAIVIVIVIVTGLCLVVLMAALDGLETCIGW